MMRKSSLLFLLCISLFSTVFAETVLSDAVFVSDGIMYHVLNDGNLEVVNGDGVNYEGDIAIPATVMHQGVERAVTRIGYRAFFQNRNVRSVTFPNTLKYIDQAFIESGVTRVSIPASVDTVAYQCFMGCASLKSFVLEDSPNPIAMNLMENCDSLQYVYQGRTVVNNSDITDKWSPFQDKPALTDVVFSDFVTDINYNAYYGCFNLKEVIIPDHVKVIGENAFRDCAGVDNLHIGKSVEEIGRLAFNTASQRRNLKTLRIPGSVRKILSEAFAGNLIDTLIFEPGDTILASVGSDGLPLSLDSLKYLEIHRDVDNKGKSLVSTVMTKVVIGDEVSLLSEGVFSGCKALDDVLNLPNLKYIGRNCFNKSNLRKISLSPEVEYIGPGAFTYSELSEFEFDFEKVDSIFEETFSGCSSLKTVRIGSNVRYIGDRAFAYCNSLESINLPDFLEEIGSRVFYRSRSIKSSLALPASLRFVSDRAFEDAPVNAFGQKLAFGNSIESVGESSFGQLNINQVFFNTESSVNVGMGCFPALTAVTLPFNGLRCEDKKDFYVYISTNDDTHIYSLNRNVPDCDVFKRFMDSDNASYYYKGTLHVPAGCIDAYRADSIFGMFRNITDDLVADDPNGIRAVGQLTVTVECQPFADGGELTLYADADKTVMLGSAVGTFDSQSRASRLLTFTFDGLTTYDELYYRLSSLDADGVGTAMTTGSFNVNDPTSIEGVGEDDSTCGGVPKSVYDLQGRRLDEPVVGAVNIIDGRKVLIR